MLALERAPLEAAEAQEPRAAVPPLAELFAREGDFLWRTLQRFGVRPADCPDVLQAVLLTVHERAHTYDGRAPLRAWLYGICLKHAAAHRRRAWVRREQPTEPAELPGSERPSNPDNPEKAAAAREAQERLRAMLDELDEDKRAVLVMYELEELPCEQIAEQLGVPVGTVHSRLSHARKAFRAVLDRWNARERRQVPR